MKTFSMSYSQADVAILVHNSNSQSSYSNHLLQNFNKMQVKTKQNPGIIFQNKEPFLLDRLPNQCLLLTLHELTFTLIVLHLVTTFLLFQSGNYFSLIFTYSNNSIVYTFFFCKIFPKSYSYYPINFWNTWFLGIIFSSRHTHFNVRRIAFSRSRFSEHTFILLNRYINIRLFIINPL